MRSVILAIVCGTRHRPRDRPPSTDVREESAAPIRDRVETESGEVDGIHCYRTAWRMGVRGACVPAWPGVSGSRMSAPARQGRS